MPARQAATFPWTSHALWFYSQMVRWHQIEFNERDVAAVRGTWRPDLYRLALASLQVNLPTSDSKIEGAAVQRRALPSSQGVLDYGPDGFFDGRQFDPGDLAGYLQALGSMPKRLSKRLRRQVQGARHLSPTAYRTRPTRLRGMPSLLNVCFR